MARAVNKGWDFVKVGETYQYKEDWFIAMVTVLEDLSDDNNYHFKLQMEKASHTPFFAKDGIFELSHIKKSMEYLAGWLNYMKPKLICVNINGNVK